MGAWGIFKIGTFQLAESVVFVIARPRGLAFLVQVAFFGGGRPLVGATARGPLANVAAVVGAGNWPPLRRREPDIAPSWHVPRCNLKSNLAHC